MQEVARAVRGQRVDKRVPLMRSCRMTTDAQRYGHRHGVQARGHPNPRLCYTTTFSVRVGPSLLLYAIQVIDNHRNATSNHEVKAPNWHFTIAVSSDQRSPINNLIHRSDRKHPVISFSEHCQVGRRRLEHRADKSVSLAIHTMAWPATG
jgi:hypothetical protein